MKIALFTQELSFFSIKFCYFRINVFNLFRDFYINYKFQHFSLIFRVFIVGVGLVVSPPMRKRA